MFDLIFVIVLLVILAIFYTNNCTEKFVSVDFNNYQNMNSSKLKFLTLANPNPSDIDYQDYLNTVSGYDAGTRTYDNPLYAQQVALGLDTN